MEDKIEAADVLQLTAQIVSAFASNNSLGRDELPDVIRTVHRSLADAERPMEVEAKPAPAVPVRQSLKRDYIACIECGTKHKMLRRHLRREHGLTPQEYRDRWSLKSDYPMVAPSYAEKRSELAKRIGLGRERSQGMNPQGSGQTATTAAKPKRQPGRKAAAAE